MQRTGLLGDSAPEGYAFTVIRFKGFREKGSGGVSPHRKTRWTLARPALLQHFHGR